MLLSEKFKKFWTCRSKCWPKCWSKCWSKYWMSIEILTEVKSDWRELNEASEVCMLTAKFLNWGCRTKRFLRCLDYRRRGERLTDVKWRKQTGKYADEQTRRRFCWQGCINCKTNSFWNDNKWMIDVFDKAVPNFLSSNQINLTETFDKIVSENRSVVVDCKTKRFDWFLNNTDRDFKNAYQIVVESEKSIVTLKMRTDSTVNKSIEIRSLRQNRIKNLLFVNAPNWSMHSIDQCWVNYGAVNTPDSITT